MDGAPVVALIALLAAGSPAIGQSQNPLERQPTSDEPFPVFEEGLRRLGPLRIQPEFLVRDLGYDNNIFTNEQNKAGDFTGEFLVSAAGQIRLRHRAALTARQELGAELFLSHSDQSNVNYDTQTRGDLLLGPVLLSGRGEWEKRNLTPGSEFDQRPERRRANVGLESWWLVSSITDISLELERRTFRYRDPDFVSTVEQTDGTRFEVDIGQLLDHDETTVRLRYRWKGLPLTRLSLEAARTDYVFDEPRLQRDADDRRLALGAETRDGRGWSGKVLLGKVDFRPAEPGRSGYQGLYGDALVQLRLFNRVEVPVRYRRDLEFSSFDNILYYIQGLWRVEARVHVQRSWWMLGGYEIRHVTYGDEGTVLFPGQTRRDRITTPYAGFGFRMGSAWEVEFRVGVREQQSNYDPADDRQFFVRNGVRRRF